VLNALSASTTLVGAWAGYVGIHTVQPLAPYVLCVSAANFLYIALADLIPGRRGRKDIGALGIELILIASGVATIVILRGHS
jgi:zinc and cadmium transporter